MKIGVFDSGVGGITVLSELQYRMPDLSFVYFGDTAHLPYGTKSPAQIEKLSIRCAEQLKHKRIDVLVVACNTVSSWALEGVEKVMHPIPVFGVVEPGVEAVLSSFEAMQKKVQADLPVLVLATRATVRSHAYGRRLLKYMDQSQIIEQSCPLLVPMIEEGWIDHPLLHQVLAEYLKPYQEISPGVALLGCTHYPWIHEAFAQALPGWSVVNSARAIADSLEKSEFFLKRRHSFQKSHSLTAQDPLQKIEWIFTDPEAVPEFAQHWILNVN